MTDDNVSLDLISHQLRAIQAQLATLDRRVSDVHEDQKLMREQVDVVVMTSLRLEHRMSSIRDEGRELRQRIDRLEAGPT